VPESHYLTANKILRDEFFVSQTPERSGQLHAPATLPPVSMGQKDGPILFLVQERFCHRICNDTVPTTEFNTGWKHNYCVR
jgi:hypothetical protein